MADAAVAKRVGRVRPGVLPGADAASLRRERLALPAEAAALIGTAWQRIHEAAASRLCLVGGSADDSALGMEDALAALAVAAAGLDRAVLQPALGAQPPGACSPAAVAS